MISKNERTVIGGFGVCASRSSNSIELRTLCLVHYRVRVLVKREDIVAGQWGGVFSNLTLGLPDSTLGTTIWPALIL